MANAEQAHRGPNQEGVAEGEGWLLSHRRLAIFDLSDQGRQPLTLGPDLTIVFNGAVYNFPELREQLRRSGGTFVSDTDTEVILAAYREWGTDCFARFNGMWAIAIIDAKARRLVLSRDRVGIKPLYVNASSSQLSFASETRALRLSTGSRASLNLEVAGDFLQHGWQDHRPETCWEGIRQFPAGHFAVYDLDTLKLISRQAYNFFPQEEDKRATPALLEQFRALLTDSVRLRTRSDVGYGLTLSGGIDSSAIAGLLGRGNRTYSVRFPGTVYDESTYIDSVLAHRSLSNESIVPSWADFIADHEACQYAQDQPLASAAVVAHYALMKRIGAKGERVVLNGQGADEIGAGYDKFYLPYLKEQWRKNKLTAGVEALQIARTLKIAPDQFTNRFSRLMGSESLSRFLAPELLEAASSFQRLPDSDIRQTSVNLLTGVGMPVLLRHVDRNSMAFGIESRPPFLDYRIVNFLLAAPAGFKIRNGIRKWGIRESVRPLLPRLVYERKRKLGFATPQNRWMEEHSAFFAEGIRAYTASNEALLLPAAAEFAAAVLSRRRSVHYPTVWRWWAWANFTRLLREA